MIVASDTPKVRQTMAELFNRASGGPLPACPRCGCRDCRSVVPPDAAGRGVAACNHCQREFSYTAGVPQGNGKSEAQEPLQVVVKAGNCPECGSVAPSYTVKKGVQYRKCSECGHRYKTSKPRLPS